MSERSAKRLRTTSSPKNEIIDLTTLPDRALTPRTTIIPHHPVPASRALNPIASPHTPRTPRTPRTPHPRAPSTAPPRAAATIIPFTRPFPPEIILSILDYLSSRDLKSFARATTLGGIQWRWVFEMLRDGYTTSTSATSTPATSTPTTSAIIDLTTDSDDCDCPTATIITTTKTKTEPPKRSTHWRRALQNGRAEVRKHLEGYDMGKRSLFREVKGGLKEWAVAKREQRLILPGPIAEEEGRRRLGGREKVVWID